VKISLALLKYGTALCCLLMLLSCNRSLIIVQTEYLSHKNLASYHVGTPDPMLFDPPIGQRLTISWNIPKHYLTYDDLHIKTTVRLRNHQEVVEKFRIDKPVSNWVYALMNKDYCESGGILTYKVELFGCNEVIDAWYHQLWTDLIQFEK
jgi:hypothetical protein